MKKRRRARKRERSAVAKISPPTARLPLPVKGEKRHEDRKKYERAREKERLRRNPDG